MLPVFVLKFRHIIRTAVDFPQQLVIVINIELPVGEAHGRGTVAAAATLVKDECAVLGAEAINDDTSGFGDIYFRHG
jgi:hypothetical protein